MHLNVRCIICLILFLKQALSVCQEEGHGVGVKRDRLHGLGVARDELVGAFFYDKHRPISLDRRTKSAVESFSPRTVASKPQAAMISEI